MNFLRILKPKAKSIPQTVDMYLKYTFMQHLYWNKTNCIQIWFRISKKMVTVHYSDGLLLRKVAV